jgi:hypothetical protein
MKKDGWIGKVQLVDVELVSGDFGMYHPHHVSFQLRKIFLCPQTSVPQGLSIRAPASASIPPAYALTLLSQPLL